MLSASEIKGGQYKGGPDTIQTISYDVPLVWLPEVLEGFVYEMAKLIFGRP